MDSELQTFELADDKRKRLPLGFLWPLSLCSPIIIPEFVFFKQVLSASLVLLVHFQA